MTPQLMGLSSEPLQGAIGHSAALTGYALLVLCFGLVVDRRDRRAVPALAARRAICSMTREEVQEEYKESEGSPETRGRIREAQRALARGRMMQEVPKADVVVTNPTHFAVALRYDETRNRAPIVVAKGTDLLAAKIREIAAENGVPIFEAPPLARALLPQRRARPRSARPRSTSTVAQVLTYVYQLKAAQARGAEAAATAGRSN